MTSKTRFRGDRDARGGFQHHLLWVTALFIFVGCQEKPLENFGETNSFELVTEQGDTFSSDSMKGKVWLTSFFFTRCKTICPKILGHLKSVEEEAKSKGINLHMISMTVDPEHDTPERLLAKHQEIGASEKWTFLTGSREKITDVVVKGFKTHMGEEETLENGLIEIGHGAKLLLIDPQGIIRGLFDTTPEEQVKLIELAKRLQP